MTKTETINAIAEATGMTKKEVTLFFESLLGLAYGEVKKSGEFIFPGLGKLVKVNRKARMGRNPATGESIKIAAKTVVKFKLAKAAKDSLL
jgi:DNA-binding protein HU-beta